MGMKSEVCTFLMHIKSRDLLHLTLNDLELVLANVYAPTQRSKAGTIGFL